MRLPETDAAGGIPISRSLWKLDTSGEHIQSICSPGEALMSINRFQPTAEKRGG